MRRLSKAAIFLIMILNFNCCVIFAEGLFHLTEKYDSIDFFKNGSAVVTKDGKKGIINLDGEVLVPFKYNTIRGLGNGLFEVGVGNDGWQRGIINIRGEELVKPTKQIIGDLKEGMIRFELLDEKKIDGAGGYIGFYNENGEVAIPPQDWDARDFSGGLANVKIKYSEQETPESVVSPGEEPYYSAYIDKKGNIAIPAKYRSVYRGDSTSVMFKDNFCPDFKNDRAVVWDGDGYGIIDAKGREIVPCQYNFLKRSLYEDIFLAQEKGTWLYGYIDADGNQIIPFKYKEAAEFSSGLAYVEADGWSGYIDTAGKLVFEYKRVRNAPYFKNGIAITQKEIENHFLTGAVNSKGELIIPFEYDYIVESENLLLTWLKSENNLSGYRNIVFDKNGSRLFELGSNLCPSWDGFKEGLLNVDLVEQKHNGEIETKSCGFVDRHGNFSSYLIGSIVSYDKNILGDGENYFRGATVSSFSEGFAIYSSQEGVMSYIRTPLKNIRVNNEYVPLTYYPEIENGMLAVPVIDLSNYLGLECNYDKLNNTVIFRKGSKELKHKAGTNFFEMDNETKYFQTESYIKGEDIIMPARILIDSFDFQTSWQALTNTLNFIVP